MTSAIATPKSVFDAADELHGSGQALTIDAVIAKIGGGSKSTVGPLLEAWRLKGKPGIEPMPEGLEVRARALASAIWSEAMCKLEPRIAAARNEFRVELEARDLVVERALEQIRAMEADVQRLHAALEAERMRCAGLLARLEAASANRETEQLISDLENARAECAQHARTNIKLAAENALMREQFAMMTRRQRRQSKAPSPPKNPE
ncbi:hypothetical protein HHL11_30080 [Ramlibacter sp. G-1-2-2]|uniref:KfrA N-terminal DNA-binding domain-containing protein n=1 Tax=Ramlibacter agri TaxID=2728837 RepID=A0A848HB82_9BURK|nr:DNA-binding protein [Ramlibacter agri]NML48035.1 hypothetical protein [Ramlibacter agri]